MRLVRRTCNVASSLRGRPHPTRQQHLRRGDVSCRRWAAAKYIAAEPSAAARPMASSMAAEEEAAMSSNTLSRDRSRDSSRGRGGRVAVTGTSPCATEEDDLPKLSDRGAEGGSGTGGADGIDADGADGDGRASGGAQDVDAETMRTGGGAQDEEAACTTDLGAECTRGGAHEEAAGKTATNDAERTRGEAQDDDTGSKATDDAEGAKGGAQDVDAGSADTDPEDIKGGAQDVDAVANGNRDAEEVAGEVTATATGGVLPRGPAPMTALRATGQGLATGVCDCACAGCASSAEELARTGEAVRTTCVRATWAARDAEVDLETDSMLEQRLLGFASNHAARRPPAAPCPHEVGGDTSGAIGGRSATVAELAGAETTAAAPTSARGVGAELCTDLHCSCGVSAEGPVDTTTFEGATATTTVSAVTTATTTPPRPLRTTFPSGANDG
mmetsp:Transcript_31813/g.101071  ORF Transcript_31813/g.101071 Transcript_31813/m.101071 type:complete len:444 (+) Transcript_31813:268-1599(+)